MPIVDGPHPEEFVPDAKSTIRDTAQIPPRDPTEVGRGVDWNKVYGQLRALGSDIRDTIIALGGTPDAPTKDRLADVIIQGIIDNAPGGGGGGVSGLAYREGLWYGNQPNDGATFNFGISTGTVLNRRLGVTPVLITEAITIDAIGVWLLGSFATGTNGKWRGGIWKDNNGLPGDLLADSGEIIVVRAANITDFDFNVLGAPVDIPAGVVWVGSHSDDIDANSRCMGAGLPVDYHTSIGWDQNFLENNSLGRNPNGFVDQAALHVTPDSLPDPFGVSLLTVFHRFGGDTGVACPAFFRIATP